MNMCVLPVCGSFEFAMWMLAEIDVLLAVHICLLKTEHYHNVLPFTETSPFEMELRIQCVT